MYSQPYSLAYYVRPSVATVRHGHGGHSSETTSAREGEALESSQKAQQLGESELAKQMRSARHIN